MLLPTDFVLSFRGVEVYEARVSNQFNLVKAFKRLKLFVVHRP